MAQQQYKNPYPHRNPYQQPRPIPQQPHKPAPKGRFNKVLLLAPGAILLCLFMIHGIQPAGKWDDFLEAISIENKPRFTALMILGCIACCLCAIARILRRNSGD